MTVSAVLTELFSMSRVSTASRRPPLTPTCTTSNHLHTRSRSIKILKLAQSDKHMLSAVTCNIKKYRIWSNQKEGQQEAKVSDSPFQRHATQQITYVLSYDQWEPTHIWIFFILCPYLLYIFWTTSEIHHAPAISTVQQTGWCTAAFTTLESMLELHTLLICRWCSPIHEEVNKMENILRSFKSSADTWGLYTNWIKTQNIRVKATVHPVHTDNSGSQPETDALALRINQIITQTRSNQYSKMTEASRPRKSYGLQLQ